MDKSDDPIRKPRDTLEQAQPLPRHLMTPITMAGEVVHTAHEVFMERLGPMIEDNGSDPNAFFFDHIFGAAWADETIDGDISAQKFFEDFDCNPAEASQYAGLRVIEIAIAYAIGAFKEEKKKEHSQLAWSYAASGKYWAGILRALSFGADDRSAAASMLAKMRHAENYALTQDVESYWRKNVDPSLSAQRAAEHIIRANVVPLSHKKIAEIVSRLRKAEGERKA